MKQRKFLSIVALFAAPIACADGVGGWSTVPLGPPGTLTVPTAFVNKPSFRAPSPFRPGLVLWGGGKKASIVAPKGDRALRALADECAWHLSRMSGADFAVADTAPAAGPAVVFGRADAARAFGADVPEDGRERAVVKRAGERLFVGGTGAGASHALTHVLEALGCRYLWPGESGKVIPRRREIVLPADVEIVFSPQLVLRGVRVYSTVIERMRWSLRRLGFDPDVYKARFDKAAVDRPGNRGFFQWHGVNDTADVAGYSAAAGRYEWGHYFGDYIERYHKTHPEWFALQMDGTREMREAERPTLCLSNEALARETVSNLVAKFRARPGRVAVSACLPDGGTASHCLCPACRRLDPADGARRDIITFIGGRRRHAYVSLTDRVLTFSNRLAEGVDAALPGKKLTFYAYTNYQDPPRTVKPHPGLIIFSVAGDYSTVRGRLSARANLAGWSSFGNEMFWRPNALRCYNVSVPQDISRHVFDDLELFKANNVIGTDFDCMDDQWAVKGLAYYMTAKAHLNMERRSYDDLLDDYCRAGFGAAAGIVKAYFAFLAAETDRVAAANGSVILADGREVGSGADAYVRTFDVDRAAALIDRAEKAAAGDPESLRRVRFLRWGVDCARHEQRCARALRARDRDMLAYQRDFLRFYHAAALSPDGILAVNPSGEGFYNSRIRGALVERAKRPPAGGARETLRADPSGRDRTGDVTAALARLHLAGGGTLTFESGDYRFASSSAVRLRFGISNHDPSADHPVLFPLWGMTNITLNAEGARFTVDSPLIVFSVKNAAGIRFRGFSVDFARSALSEGVIRRFDGGQPVVAVDGARFPFALSDGRLVKTAPGWRSPVGGLIVFDGAAGGIVPGSGDVRFDGAAHALADGLFRLGVDLRAAVPAVKAGDVVVFRPARRPSPVFFVSSSRDVSLTDVVVHDAHGMALLAQVSRDISWRGTAPAAARRSGVFPSRGRVSSTHADATHFSNVGGDVVVENNLFEGMMDDAINVHSTALVISSVGRDGRLLCRYAHAQAVGFDVFRPGERLRFIRGKTLENGPEAVVTGVRPRGADAVFLTLDRPVPAGFGAGDAVENADLQPRTVFRGNRVRRNRARAALFTTPRRVVVDSNRFERVSGSAVLLAGDVSRWYETGACADVTIRGNVFSNCCASAKRHGYCGGVVSICPTVPDPAAQKTPYHRGVRIEDNVFYTFDVPLLFARSAEDVVFADNTCVRNADYPGWGQKPIVVDGAASVRADLPSGPPIGRILHP